MLSGKGCSNVCKYTSSECGVVGYFNTTKCFSNKKKNTSNSFSNIEEKNLIIAKFRSILKVLPFFKVSFHTWTHKITLGTKL